MALGEEAFFEKEYPRVVDSPPGYSMSTADSSVLGFDERYRSLNCEMPEAIRQDARMAIIREDDIVEIVEARDHLASDQKRLAAQRHISEYLAGTKHMFEDPTFKVWKDSVGTALNLVPLYFPTHPTMGAHIKPEIFKEKLFISPEGKELSAVDYRAAILREDGKSRRVANRIAGRIHEHHLTYLGTPITGEAADIFKGSVDAIGVRTRPELVTEIALDALPDPTNCEPLTLLSVGCGSAVPLFRNIQSLKVAGYDIERVHLLDADPMALSAAMSLADYHGIDRELLELHVYNLLSGKPFTAIEPGSVSFGDAIGTTEYFRHRSAVNLSKFVLGMIKPGGAFSFTNMHPGREEIDFFLQEVDWKPSVKMRGVAESIDILEDAGAEGAKCVVPTQCLAYLGYVGTVPLLRKN
jgi:hypothetical protein